jgi:hypothetical protein
MAAISTSAQPEASGSPDRPAPAAPQNLTLTLASDSGIPSDGQTDITTPVITGTGTAGDIITLSDVDGDTITAVGTATVASDGTWSITTTALDLGAHVLSATDTDQFATSPDSVALDVFINPVVAPPSAPVPGPGSDTGTPGDGITSNNTPVLSGTGLPGDLVVLHDGTIPGSVGIVHVGENGNWSVTASALSNGTHTLTATQVDSVTQDESAASAPLVLTVDTSVPAAPAGLVLDPASDSGTKGDGITNVTTPVIDGTGTAGDTVTLYQGTSTTPLGSATVGADGTWAVTSSTLANGTYSLTAKQTNAAGTMSQASTPLNLTINTADGFTYQDNNPVPSGTFQGSDYTGPVSYLQAQFGYTGSDSVVIGATVPNAFIYSGSGNDALSVVGGSNVLDGGSGSNWLVGATGADGGFDTFFVDGGIGQNTWDTLLNFHVGDMLTLFGYNAATGTLNWVNNDGAANYQGATLQANFGDAAGSSGLVTFAGLSASSATFVTSTGTTGGVGYLAVTRTA